MMFWFAAAGIVAASLFFLLRSLAVAAPVNEPAAEDVAFYRSQQGEIARQLKAGMIDDAEAKSAEAEAARKLLVRSRERLATPVADAGRSRMAQILVALAVPAIGLPLYLYLGAPHLPAQPIASRTDINRGERDFARLVDRLDAHLAEAPDDVRGLQLAFPVYMRLGRYENAADVAARLLRLNGPSAQGHITLAEAQIFANRGMVGDDARRNIMQALDLDPTLTRAQFYTGLIAEQGGDPQKALSIWRDLSTRLTDGAEKRAVALQIARLAPRDLAPQDAGPTGEAADAIRTMKPGDQQQAIRGMVDGLESRLATAGGTLDEWQRLLRALSVLGEKDRAASALDRARAQHGGSADAMAALARIATDLGLAEGAKP